MFYYALTFQEISTFFENFFNDLTHNFSNVLGFLRTLAEGVGDFIRWLPTISYFYNTVSIWIIPQFGVVVAVVITIYVIKIIIGGENK